ncbi:Uncharacterised protein [Mycobacterium tuberculosis]|nr:Uncharacterised protein [Mycobacterium tuberculosis]
MPPPPPPRPATRAAPSPHYGAGYAGGDVDSGIPTGGLRWSRGTCHRTGCLPTPAVRGRRALHGRTPPGRICLSARPEARQRQRGAVHLVRGPGDGQCRQRGHRRAFTHLVHRSGGASGRDTLRHPACFDRTFARTVAAMEEGATRRRLPGIDMGRADRGAGRQRGHCGQFCNAQRHVAGLSQPGSEPGARHPERDRHRDVVSGRARAYRVGAGRARGRSEPAHGGVRRANHPAKGSRPPGNSRAPIQIGRTASALRGCCGHAGSSRRSARRGGRTGPQSHWRVFDPKTGLPSDNYEKYFRQQQFSCARRCTSRWVS